MKHNSTEESRLHGYSALAKLFQFHSTLFVGLLATGMILFLTGIAGFCLAQPATSQPSSKLDPSGPPVREMPEDHTASTASVDPPDKAPRLSLPSPIFSRHVSRPFSKENPARPCQFFQGPIKSRGPKHPQNEIQVTMGCATRGGSSSCEIKQANYWAFLQSYYRPFDTEKWFFGYGSDAGFYRMLAPPFDPVVKGLRFCRVRVVDVGKDQITLAVPANCFDVFAPGTWARLIPTKNTESEFETVRLPASVEFATEDNRMRLAESRLLRIGNAMHKYLGTLGYFPPAIVRGSDGTPWHSWRVLILPYLGEEGHKLFRQYDLTKPWNNEHNLKLIAKMPEVYREPGEEHEGDTHSHFSVAVGESTVFPGKGCTLPNEFRIDTFSKPPHHLRFPPNNSSVRFATYIRDGSANTILVGTARTSKQTPWTQPVDVALRTQPNLEGPEGFVACYRDKHVPVALFLFANGRVDRVPATISPEVLHAIFTASGGEEIFAGMLPKSPEYTGYLARYNWFAEIDKKDGKTKVYVNRESP